jgi:hypothetical protein
MSASGRQPCSKPIAPYAAGTYASGRTTAAQKATARTLATARFQHALGSSVPVPTGDRIDEGDVLLDMGTPDSLVAWTAGII